MERLQHSCEISTGNRPCLGGELVEGFDTLEIVELMGQVGEYVPRMQIVITRCGQRPAVRSCGMSGWPGSCKKQNTEIIKKRHDSSTNCHLWCRSKYAGVDNALCVKRQFINDSPRIKSSRVKEKVDCELSTGTLRASQALANRSR